MVTPIPWLLLQAFLHPSSDGLRRDEKNGVNVSETAKRIDGETGALMRLAESCEEIDMLHKTLVFTVRSHEIAFETAVKDLGTIVGASLMVVHKNTQMDF